MAPNCLRRFALIAVAATYFGTIQHPASGATSSEKRLQGLRESLNKCLVMASRPGFPYYDRPEAKQACDQAKLEFEDFGSDANRNRNLACSSRVPAMVFQLWMIQFLGGPRMETAAIGEMNQLQRSCYNMDTHY